MLGLLIVVASLVLGHRFWAHGLQQLQHAGSVAVALRLSCSEACGIFPDQGWNLCSLHWWADSYPLCHQGNPNKSGYRITEAEEQINVLEDRKLKITTVEQNIEKE